MLQGALHVMEPHSDGRAALPIDYFFRSLADDQGDRAIGVILSGTGTDGTLGLKAIKAHAGMTMAQEPQVAKYAGMPESAIRSGAVDYVRPAGSMVEQIRTFLTGAAGRDAQRLADDSPSGRISSRSATEGARLLRPQGQHEPASHRAALTVHQIERSRYRYLQVNPRRPMPFRELLIGVTAFRDPASTRWPGRAAEAGFST
jgi:two-component system CheB/CheR fusion protein